MTRPARTQPRWTTRPIRSTGVLLAVLVGLLAMHGLASSHGSMPAGMSSVSQQVMAMDVVKTPPSEAAGNVLGMLSTPMHPQHGPGHAGNTMRDLCLAVLAALGLLLAVSLERRTVRTSAATGQRQPRDGSPDVASLPPPDLHLLCISRT